MSTHPQSPADGRLRPAQPAGQDRLAELIAMAAAPPAAAGPLPGEQRALAAFRAAHRGPSLQPRRQSMIQLALAKLLTVKAAAIIGGLTLTGGVAVAASTGVIPNPLRGTQPPVATPAASTPAPAVTTPADPADPAAPAAAAVFGLCTAYLAEADARLLDTPAYAGLVADAGGKENVKAHCTEVAANPPGTGPQTTTPPGTTPAGNTPGTPGTPNPRSATPTPSHPAGGPTATPTHPDAPYGTPVPTRPTR